MKDLLLGTYDLHIHSAPDVTPRKCDDQELAERLWRAGLRGFAIKGHFDSTAARAALLQNRYPGMKIVGGIALNRAVGGLNPFAVETCARQGGQIVWFPTIDAKAYQKHRQKNHLHTDFSNYLSVLDERGNLSQEAICVLEVCAQYNMVVATGHLSAEEGLAVVKQASEMGIQKLVLTHADNPANVYSDQQQLEGVRRGAFVEHSFFTSYYGRVSLAEIKRQVDLVGADRVLLTTDFGQTQSPYPDEGMLSYLKGLLAEGMLWSDVQKMVKKNPAQLIE